MEEKEFKPRKNDLPPPDRFINNRNEYANIHKTLSLQGITYDVETLAKVHYKITEFIHKYAGRTSPKYFLRFHGDLMRDLTGNGFVCNLIHYVIKYCSKNNWTTLPFDNPDPNIISQTCRMFREMTMHFRVNKLIPERRIFLHPSIDPQRIPTLSTIIKEHEGSITHVPQESTHIIVPDNHDLLDEGDDDLRTLRTRPETQEAFVHWWFYPSSYDEYIPLNLVEGDTSEFQKPNGPWIVGERYVRDLAKFNEWMVEFDYEIFDEIYKKQYLLGNNNNLNYNTASNINYNNNHIQPNGMNNMPNMQPYNVRNIEQNGQYNMNNLPPTIPPPTHNNMNNNNTTTTNNNNNNTNNNNMVMSSSRSTSSSIHNTPMTKIPKKHSSKSNGVQSNSKSKPQLIRLINKKKRNKSQAGLSDPPSKRQRTMNNNNNNNSESNAVTPTNQSTKTLNPQMSSSSSKSGFKLKLTHKNKKKNKNKTKTNNNNNNSNSIRDKHKDKHRDKHRDKHNKNREKNKDKTNLMVKKEIENKNIETIHKRIEKKGLIPKSNSKQSTPKTSASDKFPYSGPILTTIRPNIPSYPIAIPSYSRWFRLDRIHPIEYHALSSLFRHKTMAYHKRYVDMRNFIINTYRMNPRVYLTMTACRRMIAADAGAILRIHRFLEEWGLINYQVDSGSVPEFEPPMVDITHIDTPFGLKKVLQPTINLSNLKIPKLNNDKLTTIPKDITNIKREIFESRENIYNIKNICSDYLDDNISNNSDSSINCSICELSCKDARYKSKIDKKFIICGNCYETKRYPTMFKNDDFELELYPMNSNNKNNNNKNNKNFEKKSKNNSNKNDKMEIDEEEEEEKENDKRDDKSKKDNMNDNDISMNEKEKENENEKQKDCNEWNEELSQKLINGYEKYDGNWKKISQFVGKSKEECMAKFIELPFLDPFIDGGESINNNNNNNNSSNIDDMNMKPQIYSSWHNENENNKLESQSKLLSFVNPDSSYPPSPFSDVTFPILGKAATLTSIVNPEIVEVAQLAAFNYLQSKNNTKSIKIGDYIEEENKEERGQILSIDKMNNTISVKYSTASQPQNIPINKIKNIYSNKTGVDPKAWKALPIKIQAQKALAAGILGGSSVIAAALKKQQEKYISQLLQQLVILQSKKVKSKLQHLDDLWDILRKEEDDNEEYRIELFRNRVEVGRQRLQVNSTLASNSAITAVKQFNSNNKNNKNNKNNLKQNDK